MKGNLIKKRILRTEIGFIFFRYGRNGGCIPKCDRLLSAGDALCKAMLEGATRGPFALIAVVIIDPGILDIQDVGYPELSLPFRCKWQNTKLGRGKVDKIKLFFYGVCGVPDD